MKLLSLSQRALPVAGWTALLLGCCALGHFARVVGVPAAHLLVPLLIGAVAALTGLVRRQLPVPANRAAQAVVGALMGSYLDPAAMSAVADLIIPLVLVTVLTVAICVGVALLLSRWAGLPRADAVLGLVPGGSAAIIACAEDLDADGRLVAFMQYLRVALVALTAPLIMTMITTSGGTSGSPLLPSLDLVSAQRLDGGLLALLGLCVLGVGAGKRVGLPAPTLLGPMLLAAIAQFTGAVQGFTPIGLLQDMAFVAVGLEVGLRFTPAVIRRIGRSFHHVLAATTLVCLACAGLAALMSLALAMPFADLYLATTPGGINAVLATAASLDAQVPLISTTQGLRLFVVVLLVPPAIRWAAARISPRPQEEPRGPAAALAGSAPVRSAA
ncbi:AbrB family transcriptional regulator [Kutzneria viridogrisea]|uniref:Membrane protein AbrB duplication n=2 Tax=Kutzneria TaxID=43356 RepID=W5W796_9PSEU|nr:AbrB family transcriptional regulator [Kutzneria albida]AHH96610.1 membrane protein AbrB duplication [Kutzneria albida DSM 43870]MBA8928170.1 hypothetical protein [Kutzneria viridogrisea]